MKRLLKIFLLLLTLLLALLLLYGCAQNSAEQSESVPESDPQPSNGTSENSETEEPIEQFGCVPGFGTIYRKTIPTDEMRKELIEGEKDAFNTTVDVPATEYWITDAEGNSIIDQPFDAVYYSDNMTSWGDEDTPEEYLELPIIMGCYRGDFYRYYLVDRTFILEAHKGYSCYDPRIDDAPFGYIYTHYYYTKFGSYYGLKDSDGNIIFDPVYTAVKVPFEDRFLLGGGGFSPEERVFTLTDIEGNKFTQFKWFHYLILDDGSYLGIAYSAGDEYGKEGRCYDENGNMREFGYWFVDKNGKILSPRYDEIHTENDDEYGYVVNSPSDIITAVDENGNTIEIKASDYICKP